MIVLGIDPGTTTIGFALLEKENSSIQMIDFGVLKTEVKIKLETKLLEIGSDIQKIILKYKPDVIVIEKLYFQNNSKTAIDVAQARGVIMYEAIKNNVTILEYTPLQVKKAVTGNGKADKLQLKNAIKILFQLDSLPKYDDTADAIGMAYMGILNYNTIKDLKK